MSILRLCIWSGPRNVSTALMYSFAQRDDTQVLDEPLYAHYLRTSGVDHPGRDEVLAAQENQGERVVRDVILGPSEHPVLFMKQMAHHLVNLDRSFLEQTANVLLIRDPHEMLVSLAQRLPHPQLDDTGLAVQSALLRELQDAGQDPAVIDSRELLIEPEKVLRRLCERLDLEFQQRMLAWPAGPREEDGVWARYWYANVHRSTGFIPYRAKNSPFPRELEDVLAECEPHYAMLRSRALIA